MALSYAVGMDNSEEREVVGLTIAILYGVWGAWVMLRGLGLLFNEERKGVDEQLLEDYDLVFAIERGLFAITTADYAFRLYSG